jgi:asparagine synthase (glutamine-hydrolysing)
VTESSGASVTDRADRTDAAAPLIRIVLHPAAFVQGPESFLAGHPLGGFASWRWDGVQLQAETDRLGLYPLFYTCDETGISLSTSLTALLSSTRSRDWDLDALGVFLRLGYFLSDDTPFRAIRAAPPRLTWKEGRLWVPKPLPEPRTPAAAARDAVEQEYGRLFREAVRKRIDNRRTFVPLSGGRDSRHIFLELSRLGASIEAAITTDSWRATERDVAAELCHRAGVRQIVVPPTYFTLGAALRRNRETSFCCDEHFWSLTVKDRLREESAECIFDGLAGDVLSQSKNLSAERLQWMRRGELSKMARQLVEAEDAFLRQILSRDFLEEMPLARVIEKISEVLAVHQGQPNPVGSFYQWNRMRREIALAPFGILRDFTAHVPFLDEDLYAFLSCLPAEFLLEEPLHDAVIRREFPEYSDVPYARAKKGAQPARPNAEDLMELGRYVAAEGGRVRKSGVISRLLGALLRPGSRPTIEAAAKWPVYLRQLSEL